MHSRSQGGPGTDLLALLSDAAAHLPTGVVRSPSLGIPRTEQSCVSTSHSAINWLYDSSQSLPLCNTSSGARPGHASAHQNLPGSFSGTPELVPHWRGGTHSYGPGHRHLEFRGTPQGHCWAVHTGVSSDCTLSSGRMCAKL